ncbi:hypothetical protein G6F40_018177 [Rhizopus arrhizus]|nr:hypothetical protein G6F40_018177 [Rhizopus arrhizus]
MHRPRIAGRAQMVQVAAGAEGGAVARQEDRADAGLALGQCDRRAELFAHVHGHRVPAFGVRQADYEYGSVSLCCYQLLCCHVGRSNG